MTDALGPVPPVLAYDLVVGAVPPAVPPGGGVPLRGGWAGPEGPAVTDAGWPRSPRTGQPLHHCVTVWLPPAYRRSPGLVAVSVFQWLDEDGWEAPAPDLVLPPPHPHSSITVHPHTGAVYGVLFSSEAELTGPHTRRPALVGPLAPGEEHAEDPIPAYSPTGPVWLVPRVDVNAGRAPFDPGYDPTGWRDEFVQEHLGGTLSNPDERGGGLLSPSYLELSRMGGFEFGGNDDLPFDLVAAEPLGWTRD